MRILLVNRFFDDAQTPTARMLRDVASELLAQGHEVEVLTSGGSYVGQASGARHGLSSKLRVRSVWTPHSGRLLPWGAFFLQALLRAPFLKWDRIVLLTDPPMLGVLGLAAGVGGREVYWWTMDLYPEALAAHGMLRDNTLLYRLLRRVNDLALARADGVVTLGSGQTKRLAAYRGWKARNGSRTQEIFPWDCRPLGAVTREHNRFLAAYGWQDKKVALYAGNLGEAHSYRELLAAAALLAERRDDEWRFVFVVRGAGRAGLERESAHLANVAVLDYQPDEWTSDLLWSASVHLITMRPGWDGIVVPSKLYGVLMTDAPVLFVGPPDADTALEVNRLGRGICLPTEAAAQELVGALERLARSSGPATRPDQTAPRRLASFLASKPHSPVVVGARTELSSDASPLPTLR